MKFTGGIPKFSFFLKTSETLINKSKHGLEIFYGKHVSMR